MADQKISQLPAATSASNDDVLPIVDDPGGTPATKKITFANLVASISALASVTAVAITMSGALILSQQEAGRVVITGASKNATTTPDFLYSEAQKRLTVPNATIPGLDFTNATGTAATTTLFTATTICLTGDVCRTTWPTSGGGGGTDVNWVYNNPSAFIYPATTTNDIVFGANASSSAPFYFDYGSPTSSIQIGRVGNANLFVGTSTYGGGLNSLFTMNGDDLFVQSNMGVLGTGYFGTATATSMFANSATFGGLTTNSATIGGGTINATAIGGSTAAAGSFTTLNASGLSALANITFTGATGTSGSVTGIWSMGTATGTNGNFNSSQIGSLTGGSAALASLTVGGQSVCLANGTNCPSSYSTLTITTLSSTNINVRNIREANGSTASSTIVLSGRSGEIDTSSAPRPTSTLLVVGGVPRTLPAMNATSTNCIYWGPEWIRDSWDGLQLKPTISWTNSTGSGAIVWRVRAESITDAESIGTAWSGGSSFATGTASTAFLNQNDAMDALTVGGATTGTPMRFELCRIGGQAGDTFGADGYPNSLKIEYGLGSYSD